MQRFSDATGGVVGGLTDAASGVAGSIGGAAAEGQAAAASAASAAAAALSDAASTAQVLGSSRCARKQHALSGQAKHIRHTVLVLLSIIPRTFRRDPGWAPGVRNLAGGQGWSRASVDQLYL